MRKDWLLLIVVFACFVVSVVVLFLWEGDGDKVQPMGAGFEEAVENFDDGGGDVVGGYEVSSGIVNNADGVVGEGDFVSNISEAECGFYFKGYGVCNGTCPDGECVSEGRSCYCKIV